MANKLVRPLASPFTVIHRGQSVEVNQEKAFISGGFGDDFHVQWTKGYIDGLGAFVKVVISDDDRTFTRGYRLLPGDIQTIMDNPTSGAGNFTLEEVMCQK